MKHPTVTTYEVQVPDPTGGTAPLPVAVDVVDLLPLTVRVWLYRIALAVGVALVSIGKLTNTAYLDYVGIVGLVLGLTTANAHMPTRPKQAARVRRRQ